LQRQGVHLRRIDPAAVILKPGKVNTPRKRVGSAWRLAVGAGSVTVFCTELLTPPLRAETDVVPGCRPVTTPMTRSTLAM